MNLFKYSIAMAAVAAISSASAQDIDWKQGKLGRLSTNIGTYHYDAVLNDPIVAAAMAHFLSPAGLKAFKDNMSVQTPIAFDGQSLILKGLMAHGGGTDEAVLAVKPYDGKIEGAMLHAKRVISFSEGGALGGVSSEVAAIAGQWAAANGARVEAVKPR